MKRRRFMSLFSFTLLVFVAPKIKGETKFKKDYIESAEQYVILDGWVLKGSDFHDV